MSSHEHSNVLHVGYKRFANARALFLTRNREGLFFFSCNKNATDKRISKRAKESPGAIRKSRHDMISNIIKNTCNNTHYEYTEICIGANQIGHKIQNLTVGK